MTPEIARKLAEDLVYPLGGNAEAVELAVRLIQQAVEEDELRRDLERMAA